MNLDIPLNRNCRKIIKNKIFNSGCLALLLTMSGCANAVNNIVIPEMDANTPALNQVGRFSTLHFSEVGLFGTGSTGNIFKLKNRVFMGMQSPCFGSGRAGDKPGVLVLDVKNPASPLELGRLPFIANVAPQNGSVALAANAKTLKSGDILAVNISGASCIPIFGVEGKNGIELWDVSNPDITKAKLLSFTQVRDVNTLAASTGVNPTLGSGIESVELYRQGSKDYMAVTIGAGSSESRANIGGLQIYDITDPAAPQRVGYWGPEVLAFPGVDLVNANTTTTPTLATLEKYVRGEEPSVYGRDITGFSLTRRVSDVYVPTDEDNFTDGKRMYVGSGIGTLLLDASDPSNIKHVSTAVNDIDSARALRLFGYGGYATANHKIVMSGVNPSPFYLSLKILNAPDFIVKVSEFAFAKPIGNLPGGILSSSNSKYVGLACMPTSPVPAAPANTLIPPPDSSSQIAIASRGVCAFSLKVQNLKNAGYAGVVMINSKNSGDAAFGAAGTPVDLPAVGIPYFAGLKILGLTTAAVHPCPSDVTNACLPNLNNFEPSADPNSHVGRIGSGLEVKSNKLKYGHLRIWDYSNSKNPQLLSTVDTQCSIDPQSPTCVAGSSQSVYPVKIEGDTAYVIWQNQGLVILDIKNPSLPKVVARYKITGDDFFNQNGGLQLMESLDKDRDSGCIYAADLNGGLYILSDPNGKKCK
jgi:hypothetical protein